MGRHSPQPRRSPRRICAIRRSGTPLQARGLAQRRAVTRSPHVSGEITAEGLASWATGLIAKRIATFEARRRRALKRDLDGEALHDLRTAARRLRSALEDLGPLVPYSRKNLRIVKRIGDATSEARDLAVLIGRLQAYRALAGKRNVPKSTTSSPGSNGASGVRSSAPRR